MNTARGSHVLSRARQRGGYAVAWKVTTAVLMLVIALWTIVDNLRQREHTPWRVATFPGPTPGAREYELWYARDGDLTVRPAVGNPSITYRDYYESTELAKSEWRTPEHLILTMRDGTTIDVHMGFEFATSRPAAHATTSQAD